MATDTIAAVATGAGRAGIGVVRISGPQAPDICRHVLGRQLTPRTVHHGPFLDDRGDALDVGIALYFEAPQSYTGEHVLELQGHGGPVVLDGLLHRVCSLGARPARPGEFSERAFLNDKLDLAQAEAVADLIDASSAGAARAAVRSLAGEMSTDVNAIVAELIALRVWLEAALDFSEEDIDFLADASLATRAHALVAAFDRVLARAGQGQRLRDGLTVAIAGQPNVGKSSLLNALAQTEAAIVTDVPGTTRDLLHENILIGDLPVHLVDTAGLRDTDDTVERIGIERARNALLEADVLMLVVDARDPRVPTAELPDTLPDTVPRVLVYNKIDLLAECPTGPTPGPTPGEPSGEPSMTDGYVVKVSALRGDGLEQLREHLLTLSGRESAVEGVYLARRRHLEALQQARAATRAGLERLQSGNMPELAAEELRAAQQSLEQITGRFDADDLLGAIFGSFCIGK